MEQTTTLTDFANDTLKGLSSNPKFLSSKYFYDEKGSRIFQDIMQMPEYYLTNCELEIFSTQKQDILEAFTRQEEPFELIELGAGDGLKTKVLLSHFMDRRTPFKYIAIDISEDAVKQLVNELAHEIPGLNVSGLVGDYFELIKDLDKKSPIKKIILFLGSNIGNFNETESLKFLRHLKTVLNTRDLVFIGLDMKKDPDIILKAYNDPHGHTAAFNLNLLQRINDELNANFVLENFRHHELYDPESGTAKSELVSLVDQKVTVKELNATFTFEKGETIFMEISQKYDPEMIRYLAEKSGFEIVRNFQDQRLFFMNSLWKLRSDE